MDGLLERYLRLAEDLSRYVLLVIDDNAAGIDQFEPAAVVFGKPMNPVARNPRLVSDDSAALPCYAIEEAGFSNIGPAHDDHGGCGLRHAPS
jgi:hypothetical protein